MASAELFVLYLVTSQMACGSPLCYLPNMTYPSGHEVGLYFDPPYAWMGPNDYFSMDVTCVTSRQHSYWCETLSILFLSALEMVVFKMAALPFAWASEDCSEQSAAYLWRYMEQEHEIQLLFEATEVLELLLQPI